MDANNFKKFMDKYAGAIIGALFALIILALKLLNFVLAIGLIVSFAMLGSKMQKNKATIKEKVKAFIDKI